MTPLDAVLAVVWLGVVLGGFWKGAVRIVFGLGGATVGIWLAVAAHVEMTTLLSRWVSLPWLAALGGWLLPPVLCLTLALVAGWGTERTLEALHLGWLNRVAGAVLAGLVGAALLGLLLLTAAAASPAVRRLCDRSLVAPVVTRFMPAERDQPVVDSSDVEPDEGASSGR